MAPAYLRVGRGGREELGVSLHAQWQGARNGIRSSFTKVGLADARKKAGGDARLLLSDDATRSRIGRKRNLDERPTKNYPRQRASMTFDKCAEAYISAQRSRLAKHQAPPAMAEYPHHLRVTCLWLRSCPRPSTLISS